MQAQQQQLDAAAAVAKHRNLQQRSSPLDQQQEQQLLASARNRSAARLAQPHPIIATSNAVAQPFRSQNRWQPCYTSFNPGIHSPVPGQPQSILLIDQIAHSITNPLLPNLTPLLPLSQQFISIEIMKCFYNGMRAKVGTAVPIWNPA